MAHDHVHTAPTAEDLLSSRDLRVTKPRLEVLQLFLDKEGAQSQHELEQQLPAGTDRVTVYRTLKTFVQSGLLHQVPDDQFGHRYALCDTHDCAADGDHHHDHLHFKCNQCGDTLCLDDVRLPALPVPSGFKVDELTILAKGTCKNCAA